MTVLRIKTVIIISISLLIGAIATHLINQSEMDEMRSKMIVLDSKLVIKKGDYQEKTNLNESSLLPVARIGETFSETEEMLKNAQLEIFNLKERLKVDDRNMFDRDEALDLLGGERRLSLTSVFGLGFEVSDQVSKILKMTPIERKVVSDIFANSQEELSRSIVDYADVKEQGNTTIMSVSNIESLGKDLETNLKNRIEDVIGLERMNFLMKLNIPEDYYLDFGKFKSYELKYERPDLKNKKWLISRKLEKLSGGSSSRSSASVGYLANSYPTFKYVFPEKLTNEMVK